MVSAIYAKTDGCKYKKISKPPQKSCTIVAGVQAFLLRKEIVVVPPTTTIDKLLTQTRVCVVVPTGEEGVTGSTVLWEMALRRCMKCNL